MTTGRVTESSIHTRVLANLQRSIAKGQKLQDQLSSGRQINRPSDSPTGTVASLQLRGESRAAQQYSRNADDGLGWLGTLDNTLTTTSTLINRARDLTVQGLSSGSNDVQSQEALAVEIDNIKSSLIGYANTKYLDRPVFGGTTAGDAAYLSDGTYVGDKDVMSRTVGADTRIPVSAVGPKVFGDGDAQVFAVLQRISEGLRAGNADGLTASLKDLDSAADLVKNTLSDVGARYNRITQMKQSAQDRMLTVSSQLSDVEDVDLPKAIMEMQLQQTSYQAALAASAKVIQPSLIDFLR
jgi:flagellar hook-associated protein 3 FlgL